MKKAVVLAVLAFVVGAVTSPSHAATIDVAAGEVVVNPGNGQCSLREAILNAEAGGDTSGGDCVAGSAGEDTISLAAGSTYVLSDRDPHHVDGEVNGLPEIHHQITINGNAATIQRDAALFSGTACGGVGGKFRILYVSGLGNLILSDLTLQNGCANVSGLGAGGAIFNRGTLSLDNVTVSYNEALRSGGAIHNDGTLTLTRSTVSNNAVTAPEAGGGGIVNRGTMQVLQSTISANNGAGAGGGVDTGQGNATFANSTVSGNLSEGDGGGIFNRSPSTSVVNSTVLLNRGTNSVAAGLGSGIYVDSGTVTLTNSVVAQQANGANCSGVSGGGNNLADDATCPTATVSATPLIGPLANNGGPTRTHALLVGSPGSPAIDAGSNTVCDAPPVGSVDQRGVSRPQGTVCDIGAFEIEKYSVAYGGNGSTGGSVPTGNTYATGETVTVSGNTGVLVRTGHSFADWNTAAGSSGTPYAGGATFAMGAGGVTLYAQWTINTYTVTYNGNTGGGAPVDGSSPYNYNSTVTVLGAGSLARAGHSFAGWNTAADGSGTAYAASATFSIAADTTLFAQWTINNSYTAASATGTGTIAASFTGGGAGCGFTVSEFIPLTGNAASPPAGSAPPGVSFPEGLFNFVVSGCTPGSTLDFTVTYPQLLPPGTQYWKYGPMSTNTTPHWYVLPAVISGNVVTFSITDGGLGDDDFTLGPNGTIVDQGGPGVGIAVVPALSEWILVLLALLLVGLGVRRGLPAIR